MAYLRFFGPMRDVTGVSCAEFSGDSLADVVAQATARYGEQFTRLVAVSQIWVNGESAAAETSLALGDEVAIIPPVSGG
jgi:molybdopterin converting factor small subunit